MTQPRLRPRRPTDLDGCVDALALVHTADRYPMNWPADPRQWLTPDVDSPAWVAELDGAIVGHVLVRGVDLAHGVDPDSAGRPTAEVSRLFVVPAWQGCGLGATLLQQATRWATDHDLEPMLDVTDGERSAAIALYERAGWRHTATFQAEWTAPDGRPVMLRRYVR